MLITNIQFTFFEFICLFFLRTFVVSKEFFLTKKFDTTRVISRSCLKNENNFSWFLWKEKVKKLWYSPAPSGTFDETDLCLSLVSILSSSLPVLPPPTPPPPPLLITIWLPTDVVLTTFGLGAAVVSVQVVVPVPLFGLFRNSRIDGDLSMRLSVWSKIGPSFVPFLLSRCCNMIEPSGMPAVLAVDVSAVVVVLVVFNACVVCNSVVVLPPPPPPPPLIFVPFPLNVFASMIWLLVTFFNADCSTNLLASFDVCFDVVGDAVVAVATTELANVVFRWCKRIDGAVDVLHVVLLSSSAELLIETAPLFNKLNNSWPFCSIIWPFSVRAPRIRIILLGWCCCWCC